jgi:hypothetical protein
VTPFYHRPGFLSRFLPSGSLFENCKDGQRFATTLQNASFSDHRTGSNLSNISSLMYLPYITNRQLGGILKQFSDEKGLECALGLGYCAITCLARQLSTAAKDASMPIALRFLGFLHALWFAVLPQNLVRNAG